jgi:AP-1 complex subunit mu
MASAIFFLDAKGREPRDPLIAPDPFILLNYIGKPLLSRNYRGDIPVSAVDKFMVLLQDAEEEGVAAPCISHEGINVGFASKFKRANSKLKYLHIRHNNLYVLALSKQNSNAIEIITFLHKICQVNEAKF